ncbi:MAG TPA: glycosyltransferase family 2 protein [Methylovirgula sp.]|nr:glycosyltransferase family 2 protein [Methylovirgula sp.]
MRTAPVSHSASCALSVIVPVYREEANIQSFLKRVVPVVEGLGPFEIIFCLDPSPDKTEQLIREEAERDPRIRALVFSRRFGQPAATLAGILNAHGERVVVIDVDLQDPPELIADLWRKAAEEDLEVVTARRRTRAGETAIKRTIAGAGYSLINSIAEVGIPRDTGDFRLISRRVVEELRLLKEGHGFLRGLVSFVGFKQGEVLYDRDIRHQGRSNYNRYIGSLKIGFNGIFGFSVVPLQIMMWTGFSIALLSVLGVAIVFALKLIYGHRYPVGVPTITILVLFMGGVQLAAAGILGEYIGRIYEEVRERPQYIVDHAIGMKIVEPRGPRAPR